MLSPDKQRIQHLEARVGELEAELAAWRAYDREEGVGSADQDRVLRLKGRLARAGIVAAKGWLPAGMLLHLIDRRGAPCTSMALLEATRGLPRASGDSETGLKSVAVRVSALRRALKLLGFEGAIDTVWGLGYRVSAATADRLKAELLGEAAHG